jgi:hypothetical protein
MTSKSKKGSGAKRSGKDDGSDYPNIIEEPIRNPPQTGGESKSGKSSRKGRAKKR